jgi:hypothetical protein
MANRHGGDVAVVPQILRPRRGLNALAQKYRAHDQASRPLANRGDLISAKSGIILHPLGDRTVRDVTAPPVDSDRGRDLPLGKKTAADAMGNAPIRSE